MHYLNNCSYGFGNRCNINDVVVDEIETFGYGYGYGCGYGYGYQPLYCRFNRYLPRRRMWGRW